MAPDHRGFKSLLTVVHPLVMRAAVATPVGGRPVACSHLFLIYPSIVSTNAVDDCGRGVDGSGGRRFHRGFVLPALKLTAVALTTGGLLLLAGQAAGAEEPSTDPATSTTSVTPEFTGVDLAPADAETDGTRIGDDPDGTRIGGDIDGTRIGGEPTGVESEFTGVDLAPVEAWTDGTRIGSDIDGTRIGSDIDGTRIGSEPIAQTTGTRIGQ
jgi:hypothetical protein